ncbi:sister chromatid cohesion protein DCC1 [Onthophagus taurus]|uniref:sister chromatid cohesion protein DCC1 n=1 Tax=Onthophagus taurus TaxID=166361 RepID=UPI000C203F55|nr:sister chromatid cohesion protein DCC1 [Onthophagus taurus]
MSEDNSNTRTFEEVNNLLSLAKLNEDDLIPVSQAVYFSSNVHENNLKFLQLDKHLMECLKEGQLLYVKGNHDDSAVICTKSRTYNVIETETSNSLLLAQNLKFQKDFDDEKDKKISTTKIYGIFNSYLEVLPGKPHLKNLGTLLESTAYRGPEYESLIRDKKYTFQELLDTVQISEDELKEALKNMHCITIENMIRLLDFQYHFRVLSLMLNFIEENSWELDRVDYEETRNELNNLIPTEILDSVFDYYAEETQCIDGLQLYRYNEYKVCRFFATVLLSSAGKFNLEEFLTAWGESVPPGMIVNEDMLHGIAIIDRKSIPPVIREFKADVLPDNVIERLKVLFEVKDKWTFEEISPYVENLTSTNFGPSALLAKHTRISTTDGVKYYSSKHSR